MSITIMHKYIVDSADQITPSTLLLNLKQQDNERLFTFQPGQYAAISFYRHHRPTPARCFSIVSSPTDQRTLQFSMRTRGRFTKSAAALKPGDVVKVRGPYGGFVLDLTRYDEAVFLAGGIGITPFMSMSSYASIIQSPLKVTLIYSCQTQDDIPFYAKLNELSKQNANFRVIYVVGHGPIDKLSGVEAVAGQLTPELIDRLVAKRYNEKSFYICGPPPYMQAMSKTLRTKGVAKSDIITEAFAQGAYSQTGKIVSWPYNIYVFGAASVILGSLAVTIADIIRTLPPQSLISSANLAPTLTSSNLRQSDLDSLVNSLPETSTTAPVSPAAQSVIDKTAAVQAEDAAAATAATPTVTTVAAPVVQSAPVAAPAPVASQPVCTTTQSGVTTCV